MRKTLNAELFDLYSSLDFSKESNSVSLLPFYDNYILLSENVCLT